MHIKQPPALGTVLGAEADWLLVRGGHRSLGSGRDELELAGLSLHLAWAQAPSSLATPRPGNAVAKKAPREPSGSPSSLSGSTVWALS